MPVVSIPHSGKIRRDAGSTADYGRFDLAWSGLPQDVIVTKCYWKFDVTREKGSVYARWYEYGNSANGGNVGVNAAGICFEVAPVAGTGGTARVYLGSQYGWTDYTNVSFNIEYAYKQSSFTLSSSTVEAGNAITATIKAQSSTATYKLVWRLGSHVQEQELSAGTTSAEYTPQLSWIPSASSAQATCTLTTLEDGNPVGETQTLAFTVTVSASEVPSCTVKAELVNGFDGLYLGGRSSVKLTIENAKAGNGASIVAYKLAGSGYTSALSYATFGPLNAGTHTFTATVTDSRGRTGTAAATVTVQAYAAPTLSGISIYRSNSGGTASESGGYIALQATAAYTSLGGKNTLTLQGRYRPANGSWSGWTAMTSGQRLMLGGGGLSATASYEAQIQATDKVGNTASYASIIPTASVTFNLKAGGNGAAFGKYAETEKALELADGWKLLVGGKNVTGNYSDLSGIPGNMVRYQWLANAATYANGATITFDQDPIKYAAIFARLDWGGVAVGTPSGNAGSRAFVLEAASSSSNVKLNVVVLSETADPLVWKITGMYRIMGSGSSVTFPALSSLNIGPVWGFERMDGVGSDSGSGDSGDSGDKEPTNRVPLSIDTDGSIYNSKGYIDGYRLSSSGSLSAQANTVTTGFIPATSTDLIRMKGVDWIPKTGYCYIAFYNSSFTLLGSLNQGQNSSDYTARGIVDVASRAVTDANGVTTFNIAFSDGSAVAYCRVNGYGSGSNMFVTVNEEMP